LIMLLVSRIISRGALWRLLAGVVLRGIWGADAPLGAVTEAAWPTRRRLLAA